MQSVVLTFPRFWFNLRLRQCGRVFEKDALSLLLRLTQLNKMYQIGAKRGEVCSKGISFS